MRLHRPSARIPVPNASKPRARLTDYQVVQVFKFKLDSPQLSSSALANLYRVNEKTIRDIWKGRTWSRKTWHLDTSRPLQLKQPGRPKGSRDKQPRKKRDSEMRHGESSSSIFIGPSSDGLCGPALVKIGPAGGIRDPPLHWYNPLDRKSPSTPLHASMDEQLHDWGAFWRSVPTADPFRSDWVPTPLGYA